MAVGKPPPPIRCRHRHRHALPRQHLVLAKHRDRQPQVDKCTEDHGQRMYPHASTTVGSPGLPGRRWLTYRFTTEKQRCCAATGQQRVRRALKAQCTPGKDADLAVSTRPFRDGAGPARPQPGQDALPHRGASVRDHQGVDGRHALPNETVAESGQRNALHVLAYNMKRVMQILGVCD